MTSRIVTVALPPEVFYIILDYLGQKDYCSLRLASKGLCTLCHTKYWKRIAIARSFHLKDRRADLDRASLISGSYLVTNYKYLKISKAHIRKHLSKYTTELYMRFHDNGVFKLPGEDTDGYELLAEIFQNVRRVKLSCELEGRERLRNLQELLDTWQPSVEFSLRFEIRKSRTLGCINIANLDIRELHISLALEDPLAEIMELPIAGKDDAPIRWEDLPNDRACANLTTLILEYPGRYLRSESIPENVKVLHIRGLAQVLEWIPKLIVPSGVEYFYVSSSDFYDHSTIVLSRIDLTRARRLKTFSFQGESSSRLCDATSQVSASLERLYVRSREFLELSSVWDAIVGLGRLKELRLPIAASINICRRARDQDLAPLPEMPQLEELLLDFGHLEGRERKLRTEFMGKVVAGFLGACPGLRRMEIRCIHGQFPRRLFTMPWVMRNVGDGGCTVNISKARLELR